MNVSYTTVGNIRVPNLVLDPSPDTPIGKYGRMRKRFLEQRHDGTLTALVLSGKLTDHLLEMNQMEWLRRMNNLRARAEEIVIREVVCGE